jgi:hypothetical protein
MAKAKKTAVVKVDQDKATAAQLLEQYKVVVAAERTSFRERVKFGAMLICWEQFLGQNHAGRNSGGEGLKGWLEKHCPDIGYVTAMGYKDCAKRAVAMLGGGAVAMAALLDQTEVTAPNAETVTVDAEVLERRDELFADATSRRKLEQMYFEFAYGKGGKAGRPKAEAVALPKLKASDEAAAVWAGVMRVLDKSAVMDAVPLLDEKATRVCKERLGDLYEALKRHLEEF